MAQLSRAQMNALLRLPLDLQTLSKNDFVIFAQDVLQLAVGGRGLDDLPGIPTASQTKPTWVTWTQRYVERARVQCPPRDTFPTISAPLQAVLRARPVNGPLAFANLSVHDLVGFYASNIVVGSITPGASWSAANGGGVPPAVAVGWESPGASEPRASHRRFITDLCLTLTNSDLPIAGTVVVPPAIFRLELSPPVARICAVIDAQNALPAVGNAGANQPMAIPLDRVHVLMESDRAYAEFRGAITVGGGDEVIYPGRLIVVSTIPQAIDLTTASFVALPFAIFSITHADRLTLVIRFVCFYPISSSGEEFTTSLGVAVNSEFTIPRPAAVFAAGPQLSVLVKDAVLSADALLVRDNAVVPAPIATSNQLEQALVQLTAVVASTVHNAGKGKAVVPTARVLDFERLSVVRHLFTREQQYILFSGLTYEAESPDLTAEHCVLSRSTLQLHQTYKHLYSSQGTEPTISDVQLLRLALFEKGASLSDFTPVTMPGFQALPATNMFFTIVDHAAGFYGALTRFPPTFWRDLFMRLYGDINKLSAHPGFKPTVHPTEFFIITMEEFPAVIQAFVPGSQADEDIITDDLQTHIHREFFVNQTRCNTHLDMCLAQVMLNNQAAVQLLQQEVAGLKRAASAGGGGGGAKIRNTGAGPGAGRGGTGGRGGRGRAVPAGPVAGAPVAVPVRTTSLFWEGSPILKSEFPQGKQCCFHWLCKKAPCNVAGLCSRPSGLAHSFPTDLKPRKAAFVNWLMTTSGFKF